MGLVRILLLADTHLGFDLPFRPRIARRRRGPEFFANFQRALQPALKSEVDCVVHGGDLLYRSKVPPRLVSMAWEPLKQVAVQGIPVFVTPGNHERSAIPHRYLAAHPNIHIFDRPRVFHVTAGGTRIAFAGFPFEPGRVRSSFTSLLAQTGWHACAADLNLLCIHQTVEGAVVGPVGYAFRSGADVIRGADIPDGFAAVLAGHIHRFQVLTRNLSGNRLSAPVFYPGSTERTSFAERNEGKGYLILEFDSATSALNSWSFNELPTRPMIQIDLSVHRMSPSQLAKRIQSAIMELHPDSIVKLKLHGTINQAAMEVLRAESLRALIPSTVNMTVVTVDFEIPRTDARITPRLPGVLEGPDYGITWPQGLFNV
jgi:exonuclease SbcD